ncbi:MAG: hypothetical protein ABJD07_14800 [Gemmatimonadaceae bacterium]
MGNQNVGDDAQQGSAASGKQPAGELKLSIADQLERGADALRTRMSAGGADAFADGIVTTGDGAEATRKTIDRAGTAVAARMERTADWIRDADVDQIRTKVERKVKANPLPALLVAAGIGFLLAAVIRKGRD